MHIKSVACSGLLLCTSVLGIAAAADAPARDPRSGNWIEEKYSATYTQSEGLQLSIEELAGGVIRYSLGSNHTPENMQVIEGKCDGSRHPVLLGTGKPLEKTYACRVTGPRSVESNTMPGNRKDAARTVLIETVSADGKDLNGTWTSWDAAGKVIGEGSRHFSRRP